MQEFLTIVLAAGLATAAISLVLRRRRPPGPEPAPQPPPASGPALLHELAARIPFRPAHPSDLLADPAFMAGVQILCARGVAHELLPYAKGTNETIACMALEAICRCPAAPGVRDELLGTIGSAGLLEQWFFLRAITAQSEQDRPLIGDVIVSIAQQRPPEWLGFVLVVDGLRAFAAERLAAGELPELGARLSNLSGPDAQHVRRILQVLGLDGLQPLGVELETWQSARIDRDFLAGIGTLWSHETAAAHAALVEHPQLAAAVDDLLTAVNSGRRRSVLLVGAHGVGKTSTARIFLRRLVQRGWDVFEAGSADLIAGMKYVGEVEARMQQLARELQGRRVVWLVPDFPQLAWVGRHEFSQYTVLDYILPFVERGEIVVVGEAEPGAYERLVQMRPRCQTALQTIRLQALGSDQTLALARQWLEHTGKGLVSDATLREAWNLTQQFLGETSAPGNLLGFLSLAVQGVRGESRSSPSPVTTDDLIVTLGKLTGLPAAIIDDRQTLDLAALRQRFERRVLAQPEAIDCLVERIAMIKAGVTDPSRPAGVFLLAGPTGTGKTELAKTLAECLFGSPERMIRLDMSELQSPESLSRVFGEGRGTEITNSFVDQIRKQPFSVVLLDEFEKAHPNVWDLFLQVFDDGRLTDPRGRVADFRQAMILMTSNLGALVPSGTSLGFGGGSRHFQPQAVLDAIEKNFRRELINRIDRIVVMRPLSRDTMRDILRKEIEDAFRRRGLRNRGWAVEWEDAALEFLLERGFTRDLGARPLKRAIERYFLSPLAMTIVNHQYPQGDQFLFVKTDGARLDVEFVDPDAPETEASAAGARPGQDERRDETPPEALMLGARGEASEVSSLARHLEQLQRTVEAPAWVEDKSRALACMSDPEFWSSPQRFATLGHVEYVDRIEAGLKRSASLLERLTGKDRDGRKHCPRDLLQRLAQQLYLLDVACRDARAHTPCDAFLRVEALRGAGFDADASDTLAARLAEMYRQWAALRGMRSEALEQQQGENGYRMSMAVSGYGAYSILLPENGLHVLECPDGRGFVRHQVRVRVAPQPAEPCEPGGEARRLDALRVQARDALAAADVPRTIVRRYRESPAPLVRDAVRGWRTGRFDLVLGGHFDIVGTLAEHARPEPTRATEAESS